MRLKPGCREIIYWKYNYRYNVLIDMTILYDTICSLNTVLYLQLQIKIVEKPLKNNKLILRCIWCILNMAAFAVHIKFYNILCLRSVQASYLWKYIILINCSYHITEQDICLTIRLKSIVTYQFHFYNKVSNIVQYLLWQWYFAVYYSFFPYVMMNTSL